MKSPITAVGNKFVLHCKIAGVVEEIEKHLLVVAAKKTAARPSFDDVPDDLHRPPRVVASIDDVAEKEDLWGLRVLQSRECQ